MSTILRNSKETAWGLLAIDSGAPHDSVDRKIHRGFPVASDTGALCPPTTTVTDGIIRARFRGGDLSRPELIVPGQVYRYEIDLWHTANVFQPGHRVREQVSSSNFPRFDRNLNTGAE